MLITTGHDHHDVAGDAVVLRPAGHADGAALRALADAVDAPEQVKRRLQEILASLRQD